MVSQSTGNLNGYGQRHLRNPQMPNQSMPNLSQAGNTQQNTTRAAPQQGPAPQGRMARAAQVDEDFEPIFHSTEFPENYEG